VIEISRQEKSEQVNINDHSESEFQSILEHGLKHGGVHLVASKSHGKTRLLFSMAKTLMKREDCRVIAFDGSETWLYAFSKIPTFTVKERDIQLVNDVKTTEEIERYQLTNWNLIELALRTHKDLLFRLKTRKPSKRGYFIRTVINYLDRLQREERAVTTDNEAKGYIAFFIEEAQDCFNSRSTTKLESEEFLTVFNEGRNQKEAFFTASQRLTDFSKTIRTKQTYCIGLIGREDITPFLRRLEREYSVDFTKIQQRTWFFESKTFKSPTWTQSGKPYQINKAIKAKFQQPPQQPQKRSLKYRAKNALYKIVTLGLAGDLGDYNRPVNQIKNSETDNSEEEHPDYPEDETEDPEDADLIEFDL